MINPETGAIIDRDGLIPQGPRPVGDRPDPLDSSAETLSGGNELHGTDPGPDDDAPETNGETSP